MNNNEEVKKTQKIVEIKSLDERIQELIKLGKEQKYITFEQIVESLKGLEMDNDSLDEVYNALMESDIQVVAEGEEDATEESVLKDLEEPVILDDSEITKDINALYANIIAKKKWDDVKGSYSYGNTNLDELQDMYEDLYDELVTDGEVALTKFTVTNVDLVDVSLEDGRFEVVVKFNYDYSINYTNYAGEAATKDGSSSNRTTLVYDYFEDTYKIYDIDGTVTYFSTW